MRRSKDNGTLPLGLGIRQGNRSLFADNYLERHLTALPEWSDTAGLDEAYAAIKRLYHEKAGALVNANEAQTEHDFVRPVLDILWHDQAPGDCYQVQVTIPGTHGQRHPDYALFRSSGDRASAGERQGTIEYWRDAVALADAKGWTVSLDRMRGVNENPSAQVANYLYRSRVRWGILTNGQQWRLYEREKSSAGGVFFEVSLFDVIVSGDKEAFRHFWAFFRRGAFLPDADGNSFVDKLLQGSVDYATEVGDRLKESVYDALRLIMNGFLSHPANALDRANPEHVKLAHDNGLILLYRLLFLLYAEDKKLLPLENRVYADHSLKTIHAEINAQLRSGRRYYAGEYRFWPQLLELFGLIDEGLNDEGQVVVPAYNGGLFSAAKFPHIAYLRQPGTARWEIGAAFLCPAIDMLAYRRDKWDEPGSEDIDYNSLDVQHLGSIYEGILELRPAIADEPLVEVTKAGRSAFSPQAKVSEPGKIRGQNPRKICVGEVYLTTDRGERKATGSYYTPKYIVDYIVANTIGPLLDEAARKVTELHPEVEREIARLEKGIAEWEAKGRSEPEVARQVRNFRGEIDNQRRKLLEPYLALAVLDPAMGSGHFLVGAADFLSMAIATDPNVIAPEEVGNEDAQAYYKRLVVERCLYGVDLNAMAVELAKLSLWLHTVSKDKALSFLDHHFRCGNSLIGASSEDLTKPPPLVNALGKTVESEAKYVPIAEVLTATHLHYFLDTFRQIVESPTGTLEGERRKADLYERMDAARNNFRAVANCWLAPYFGVPIAPQYYERAVNALRNPAEWPSLEQEGWFRDAQEIAREKRFFHWELEFPERFFTAHGLKPEGERGFDGVIGNPPWLGLRTGEIGQQLVGFLRSRFVTAQSQFDLAAIFLELASVFANSTGLVGAVVPKRIATNESYEALRRRLLVDMQLLSAVDLGVAFEEVDNDAIVLVSSRALVPQRLTALGQRSGDAIVILRSIGSGTAAAMPFHIIPINADSASIKLVATVLSGPVVQFGSLVSIFRGAECGMNHPAVSRNPTESSLRVLDHLDVNRYSVAYSGWYIDPGRIEPRTLKNPEMYRETPKLLIRFLSARLVVGRDDFGYVTTNLIYHVCCRCDIDFACALLSSKLLNHWYTTAFQNEEVKFPHVQKSHLTRLPFREIEFATPVQDRAALVNEFKELHGEENSDAALALAADQLALDPPRTDVVHDVLAHLARQMIELHKAEREETAGFLAWLGRLIGHPIDDLTGKTKLKAYEEHDLDTLIGVLKQNRGKLGVNPESRSVQEEIEREFVTSVQKLGPLKARITSTDELIDQIVYKLYGLNAEEIAVVEEVSA